MNIEEAVYLLKYLTKSLKQDEKNQIYKEAIETLLTAYEKEKETNKQIKCKLDEKNIPIETLLAEFERLEDLEDDLTTVYLNGVYDGEKKVEDKIKAKIEELDYNDIGNFERRCKQEVLQSLLEKE